MRVIGYDEACAYFARLPDAQRIATLSPHYLAADAVREPNLTPVWLVYEKGEYFWLHGALKGVVPGTEFYDFQSPYGYGGPLSNTGKDYDFWVETSKVYDSWCAENRILAEFTRLHPVIRQPWSGHWEHNRQTVLLPPGCEYTPACRNKTRKATNLLTEKYGHGAIVEFGQFYREGMNQIGANRFYFFDDTYFAALSHLKNAFLLVVFGEAGEWLSAGIFLEGATVIEYHLATTTQRGRELAATNRLISEAHRIATQKNKSLYLGGGKTQNADDPLLTFKESFGGELRPFHTGHAVYLPDAYYSLMDSYFDAPPVNPKTLFWR